jgi:hypothetical protein
MEHRRTRGHALKSRLHTSTKSVSFGTQRGQLLGHRLAYVAGSTQQMTLLLRHGWDGNLRKFARLLLRYLAGGTTGDLPELHVCMEGSCNKSVGFESWSGPANWAVPADDETVACCRLASYGPHGDGLLRCCGAVPDPSYKEGCRQRTKGDVTSLARTSGAEPNGGAGGGPSG